ncbi:MAG: hypothetical protein IPJ66_20320 [Bacteroidetes bacterium]|nr:hypothetical protein [Bacteroidota bacterium]
MNTLNHSLSTPEGITKKFISREFSYKLSRFLDPSKYEAVCDGELDVFNSPGQESDIVVYGKENGFMPVVAIEICNKADLPEMSRFAQKLIRSFSLKEFFLYALDEKRWYRQTPLSAENTSSCRSESLSLSFDEALTPFPVGL